MATPWAVSSPGMSLTVTAPAVGVIRPAMERSRVDLPEPERPSRPTISFGLQGQVDVVQHHQAGAAALAVDVLEVPDLDQGASALAARSRVMVMATSSALVQPQVVVRHRRTAAATALRLSTMTKIDITAMPRATRGKSPAAVALAMKAPRPMASSVVWPQLTTSATMLAFHEPPEAVSAPVT